MLRTLQVKDLAIIDSVEIEFGAGLTVLTGETGAGKSMLVDAIELLAGGRAGAEVVRAGAERAELSAAVDIARVGGDLRRLLEEQSISEEGELLIRRAIGSDGRSRAWLNGQSVPVSVLRSVGELLFDIHGQHEFQSLMRSATQRTLLDSYGQLETLASQVRSTHAIWLALMNRSVTIEAAASDRHARLDLLRYQVQELEALQLRADEHAALAEERARIANRGRLVEAARQSLAALYEDEAVNAHQLLSRAAATLRNAGAVDLKLTELYPLLDEAASRVQDVAHSLTHYLESLDFDPARQEYVEKRLAAIEDLARKHRVEAAELPAWQGALQRELAGTPLAEGGRAGRGRRSPVRPGGLAGNAPGRGQDHRPRHDPGTGCRIQAGSPLGPGAGGPRDFRRGSLGVGDCRVAGKPQNEDEQGLRTADMRTAALGLIVALLLPPCAIVAEGQPAMGAEQTWRAFGNEPSWSLARTPQLLILETDFGRMKTQVPTPNARRIDATTVEYVTTAAGRPFAVRVQSAVCVDTMSGMPHPDRVTVKAGALRL